MRSGTRVVGLVCGSLLLPMVALLPATEPGMVAGCLSVQAVPDLEQPGRRPLVDAAGQLARHRDRPYIEVTRSRKRASAHRFYATRGTHRRLRSIGQAS
jgi:hypothetical protein